MKNNFQSQRMINRWLIKVHDIPLKYLVSAVFAVILLSWSADAIRGAFTGETILGTYPFLSGMLGIIGASIVVFWKFWESQKNILLKMGLLIAILSGSWTADGLYDFSVSGIDLFILLIFVVTTFLLFRFTGKFLSFRILRKEKCTPHQCLILPLSPPEWGNIEVTQSSQFPVSLNYTEKNTDNMTVQTKKTELILLGNSLEEDIAKIDPAWKWPWQQMMRSLLVHRESLNRIYLIGSPGKKGSYDWIPFAKFFISQYCPDVNISHHHESIPFEEVDKLYKTVQSVIKELEKEGFRDKDIIADVTGGQKLASIAMSVVTLSNSIKFQYVNTNEPYEVDQYDLQIAEKDD